MKIRMIILGFMVFILSLGSAFAETITLMSGKKVEASIVERDDAKIVVDVEGVKVPFFLSEIEKIGEEVISHAPSPQVVAEQLVVPQASDSIVENSAPEASVSASLNQPESSKPEPDVVDPKFKAVNNSIEFNTKNRPRKSLNIKSDSNQCSLNNKWLGTMMGGAFFVVILVLSLAFYVYYALCLQFIAKKTEKGPLWMAWVPIANVLLMLKIAGLSYWWLLMIFAAVIPFLGALIIIGGQGYIYYKIALARNKPGWIGILMFLPLVNLIVIGYLAFSE